VPSLDDAEALAFLRRAGRRERKTSAPGAQERPGDDEPRAVDLDATRLDNGVQISAHGITARELLELGGIRYGGLTARELERWLLREGLARRNGGRHLLVPTELGRELGNLLVMIPP
jgi:hypothetical protein